MKNIDLKLGAFVYLMVFLLFTGTLFAQKAINISGTFEGLRSQLDNSQKKITKEFQYKFELTQTNDVVEGISTIISDEGNYAEVRIRGVVVGDKFYFEEYRIIDEIILENFTWCYKTGVLKIENKNNEITLSGMTPSYMVNYGLACSGGYTKISKFIENSDYSAKNDNVEQNNFEISLFPNPTIENINFSIDLEEETKVSIEILDISGKIVQKAITRKISKGKFTDKINVSNFAPGIYIFKLTIENNIYSKEFIKA